MKGYLRISQCSPKGGIGFQQVRHLFIFLVWLYLLSSDLCWGCSSNRMVVGVAPQYSRKQSVVEDFVFSSSSFPSMGVFLRSFGGWWFVILVPRHFLRWVISPDFICLLSTVMSVTDWLILPSESRVELLLISPPGLQVELLPLFPPCSVPAGFVCFLSTIAFPLKIR